jgi:intracellular sulfur oxidation DsrE/DsrF family protein
MLFAGSAVQALVPDGWQKLEGDPAFENIEFARRHLATFESLLSACLALKVRFVICELAMKRADLEPANLDPALGVEIGSVLQVLTSDGTLLFI